jgi:hypothetical protein
MRFTQMLQRAAVGLACLGMMVPNAGALAAGPGQTANAGQTAKTPAFVDVALSGGGTLTGRVINAEGLPVDGAAVSIHQGDQEIARTVSDRNGLYAVRGLRGGNYYIKGGQGLGLFRLWAENTAPPAAKPQAVVVSDAEIARGQFGGLDLVTVTLLGTSIAGVTLGAIAVHKLKNLEDDVDELRNELRARTP